MYRAIKRGRCRGRISGTVYKFHAGQTIDAPNGDISHSPGVEWIGSEAFTPNKKPVKGTAKEIKSFLDQHGISYPAKAKKTELIDILNNS